MAVLLYNIAQLVSVQEGLAPQAGHQLSVLPCLHNAYLMVEGETIADFGAMENLPQPLSAFPERYDATGRLVMPAWCDSHTHLVYAGSRENEFVDKINGLSYADIAAKGGGILASARKLNDTPEETLFQQAYQRLQELMAMGTGAVEIKSGYGLTVEGELKMLRVIRRLKNATKMPIKATFLGAHAVPADYKDDREAYLQLLIHHLLPIISAERLADYIDVFCETGFFTPEETDRLCAAGKAAGLKPKLHVNQLSSIGGLQTGVAHRAVSVDHLEVMTPADITALARSATIGTLLPTAAFFLRMPYQPARELINAGARIALASDFNPGSSPSGNMNFVVSLSCIQLRMRPEEAVNAATLNGACAMELQKEVGSIAVGKKANIILTKPIPSLAYLPYSFGSNLIEKVMLCGEWI